MNYNFVSRLIFIQLLFQTSVSTGVNSAPANLIGGIRYVIALIFPNIAVKRAFYDFKIRENSFCITQVNTYMNCNLFIYLIISRKFPKLNIFSEFSNKYQSTFNSGTWHWFMASFQFDSIHIF